jgi:16S rRNA G966 N2-methylase RsmD
MFYPWRTALNPYSALDASSRPRRTRPSRRAGSGFHPILLIGLSRTNGSFKDRSTGSGMNGIEAVCRQAETEPILLKNSRLRSA